MKESTASVNLLIDGKKVCVPAETTILEAAAQNNIRIPTLCHHPALSERGGCRICVVEVDGAPRLSASCVTPVREGMDVVTVNERILEARRTILEFLFAERNHNCMFCPQSGDCELQALAYELQVDHLTVPQSFNVYPLDVTSPYMGIDHNRCILCGRCVRACQEIAGCYAIDFQNRGPRTLIGFDLSRKRDESVCFNCGACMQVCPTGALYNRYQTHYAVKGHAKDWQQVASVCSLCGLLCPTVATVTENRLLKVEGVIPAETDRPENGQLCYKGRFEVLKNSLPRLVHPMCKGADGSWREESWENIFRLTVEGLDAVGQRHGNGAIVGLVEESASNEEIISLRDLMAQGWTGSRIEALQSGGLKAILKRFRQNGRPFYEADWKMIPEADFILTLGPGPAVSQPAIGGLIQKQALKNRLTTAVIGPQNFLAPYTTYYLEAGADNQTLLIQAILQGVSALMQEKSAASQSSSHIIKQLGLDAAAQHVLSGIIRTYADAARPLIITGAAVDDTGDEAGTTALVELALLKELDGDNRLRLLVLKPAGNSMGAYKLLGLGHDSGAAVIQTKGGLALLEKSALQSRIPVKRLEGLEFLALITPYRPTGLAGQARILIPKPLGLETDGTYAGLNGLTTAFAPGILMPPAGIKTGWEIVSGLATAAGVGLAYESWEDLRQKARDEIER